MRRDQWGTPSSGYHVLLVWGSLICQLHAEPPGGQTATAHDTCAVLHSGPGPTAPSRCARLPSHATLSQLSDGYAKGSGKQCTHGKMSTNFALPVYAACATLRRADVTYKTRHAPFHYG